MEPKSERHPVLSSHSNCHSGLSDYNDGCNLTHLGGNDDYRDGANLPEDDDDCAFDGHEALGNEFLEKID